MKRFFSITLSVFALLAIPAIAITVLRPDWVVDPYIPKAFASTCVGNPDGKCEFNPNGALQKDPTPPDPNRPYYDQWGDKFDYQGNLISIGSCDSNTPSGANPNCAAAPTISTEQPFQGK